MWIWACSELGEWDGELGLGLGLGLVVEIGDDEERRKRIRDGEITDVEIEGIRLTGR